MKKIIIIGQLAILAALFMLLTSCFALPEEPVPFNPPMFTHPIPREFVTVTAARGDVRLTTNTRVRYAIVHEVPVGFDVGRLPIEAIFVEVGDYVRAGDLIATTGTPYLTDAQEAVMERIEEIMFRLRHATERHQTLLDVAEATGNPVDDSRNLAEIENIMDELNLQHLQLERLGFVYGTVYLRAPIDGVITQAMTWREGLLTSAGARVVAISDGVTAFILQAASNILEMVEIGDTFNATIGMQEVTLVVVDPDDHGFGGRLEWANARFLIFDGPPVPVEIGAMIPIEIIQAEAFDVIYIPLHIVREVEGRTFVYVLEDGLRQLREVEVGVVGNTSVEIISGLEEGDEVIT